MAVKLPCTFLLRGDRYDLIGMAGSNVFGPDQLPEPLRKLPKARHATYEIAMGALYLVELTPTEGNVHYLTFGRRPPEKTSATYQRMDVAVPFTGKIRLARNFISELLINLSYPKAIGFEFVIDMVLKDGRILETKDRSLEMRQKRDALKKHRQAAAKLENIRRCKTGTLKAEIHATPHDRSVVHTKDRLDGMEQIHCALKEYQESVNRLEKVLYSYDLDLDLE